MATKPAPVGWEAIPPFIRAPPVNPSRGDGFAANACGAPQQRLYFRPDPQGHGSFLVTLFFMTSLLLAARFTECVVAVELKVLKLQPLSSDGDAPSLIVTRDPNRAIKSLIRIGHLMIGKIKAAIAS